MAYCDLDDVKALNPQREYGHDDNPDSSQVGALIEQVAVEIDAVLESQGYTVPVTEPANLVNFLKYINAYGAAYLAEAGMFPETAEPGETAHWQMLQKRYDKYLKMLEEGRIPQALGTSTASFGVGSLYTEMEDQDDFPEPAFRIRSQDLEF